MTRWPASCSRLPVGQVNKCLLHFTYRLQHWSPSSHPSARKRGCPRSCCCPLCSLCMELRLRLRLRLGSNRATRVHGKLRGGRDRRCRRGCCRRGGGVAELQLERLYFSNVRGDVFALFCKRALACRQSLLQVLVTGSACGKQRQCESSHLNAQFAALGTFLRFLQQLLASAVRNLQNNTHHAIGCGPTARCASVRYSHTLHCASCVFSDSTSSSKRAA